MVWLGSIKYYLQFSVFLVLNELGYQSQCTDENTYIKH